MRHADLRPLSGGRAALRAPVAGRRSPLRVVMRRRRSASSSSTCCLLLAFIDIDTMRLPNRSWGCCAISRSRIGLAITQFTDVPAAPLMPLGQGLLSIPVVYALFGALVSAGFGSAHRPRLLARERSRGVRDGGHQAARGDRAVPRPLRPARAACSVACSVPSTGSSRLARQPRACVTSSPSDRSSRLPRLSSHWSGCRSWHGTRGCSPRRPVTFVTDSLAPDSSVPDVTCRYSVRGARKRRIIAADAGGEAAVGHACVERGRDTRGAPLGWMHC